jgi:hypothetical protein
LLLRDLPRDRPDSSGKYRQGCPTENCLAWWQRKLSPFECNSHQFCIPLNEKSISPAIFDGSPLIFTFLWNSKR